MTATTHNHENADGQQALAKACVDEAQRRAAKGIRDLSPGDIYCQALTEVADGKRRTYSPHSVAWTSAGHVLEQWCSAHKLENQHQHLAGSAAAAITTKPEQTARLRALDVAAIDLVYTLLPAALGDRLRWHRLQSCSASTSRPLGDNEGQMTLPGDHPYSTVRQYRSDLERNAETRKEVTTAT
jgi:hypothetical protein